MEEKRTILVLGATGRQGSATVKYLAGLNAFRVKALCRDVTKPSVLEMQNNGVEIIQGDYSQRNDLMLAMSEVYGVAFVSNFWESGSGVEIDCADLIIESAVDSEIQHFVYYSVVDCESFGVNFYRIHHWISKWVIEERLEKRLQESEITYTIIRTVLFMYNLKNWSYWVIPLLRAYLPPNHPIYVVDTIDIGKIATVCFLDTNIGPVVNIASEIVTIESLEKSFKAIGLDPPTWKYTLPWFLPGQIFRTLKWIRDFNWNFDIKEDWVFQEDMSPSTVDKYLERHKEEIRPSFKRSKIVFTAVRTVFWGAVFGYVGSLLFLSIARRPALTFIREKFPFQLE